MRDAYSRTLVSQASGTWAVAPWSVPNPIMATSPTPMATTAAPRPARPAAAKITSAPWVTRTWAAFRPPSTSSGEWANRPTRVSGSHPRSRPLPTSSWHRWTPAANPSSVASTSAVGAPPSAPTMPVADTEHARYPASTAAWSGWNRTARTFGPSEGAEAPRIAKCVSGWAPAAASTAAGASDPAAITNRHPPAANRSRACAKSSGPVTASSDVETASRWCAVRRARATGTRNRTPSVPGEPATAHTRTPAPAVEVVVGRAGGPSSPVARTTATTPATTARAERTAPVTNSGPVRRRPGPMVVPGPPGSVLDVDVLEGLRELPQDPLQLHELHEVARHAELPAHVRGGPGQLVLRQGRGRVVVLRDGGVGGLDLAEPEVDVSALELEPVLGLTVGSVHDLLDPGDHRSGRRLHGVALGEGVLHFACPLLGEELHGQRCLLGHRTTRAV